MSKNRVFHGRWTGARLSAVFETSARASGKCGRVPARRWRSWMALVALASIAILVLQTTAMGQPSPVGQSSPGDRLEPGMQGETMPEDLKTDTLQQPYSKGVRLLGHTDIWSRGSNLQLAWIDSCAYVSSTKPIGPVPIGANKAAD